MCQTEKKKAGGQRGTGESYCYSMSGVRKCNSDNGQRPLGCEGGNQADPGVKGVVAEGTASVKAPRKVGLSQVKDRQGPWGRVDREGVEEVWGCWVVMETFEITVRAFVLPVREMEGIAGLQTGKRQGLAPKVTHLREGLGEAGTYDVVLSAQRLLPSVGSGSRMGPTASCSPGGTSPSGTGV